MCCNLIFVFQTNLTSLEGLHKYIDPGQLTPDLEGSLTYDHGMWIELRCVSTRGSKRSNQPIFKWQRPCITYKNISPLASLPLDCLHLGIWIVFTLFWDNWWSHAMTLKSKFLFSLTILSRIYFVWIALKMGSCQCKPVQTELIFPIPLPYGDKLPLILIRHYPTQLWWIVRPTDNPTKTRNIKITILILVLQKSSLI